MGEMTLIEWAMHTCNLWWGCEEVHLGCDNCYARILARSKGKGEAWRGVRFAVGSIWKSLEKWQKAAAEAGEIHRVFCGSMMDIGEKPHDAFDWQGNPLGCTTGDLRDRFFREVVPACPNLLFLLLTKRPSNLLKMVPAGWLKDWPANVMPGVSISNHETADTLVPQILRFPVAPFVSVEPLLGPVNLTPWLPRRLVDRCRYFDNVESLPTSDKVYHRLPRLGWVIVGGESGPGSRPMHPDWARSLRDQCVAAGVPFFFKQHGEWMPFGDPFDSELARVSDKTPVALLKPDGRLIRPYSHQDAPGQQMARVGKKTAGRLLDGREWNEYPTTEFANA